MYRAVLLIVVAMFWLSPQATAQNNDSIMLFKIDSVKQAAFSSEVDLFNYIPPLQTLIDTALIYSPKVQFYENRAEAKEYEVALERKAWADDIRFGGVYNYGSLGQLDDIVLGYQFSVGVSIPLSTFIGRYERIKQRESELKAELSKADEMSMEVVREVTREYNNLILMKRLMEIQGEAKESAALIMEMSEEKFRDGQLTLDQLGQNTELKAKYYSQYEEIKFQFLMSYKRLEQLVGMPFSRFEKN
ncbi:MAG: hypothetical protein SchgKO_06570 [Schleiferiaceae bacterium]